MTADARSDQNHLLCIYLRDHEAAAVGGLQLFHRCWKANRGTRYAAELQRMTDEVRADRDSLRSICHQFGVRFSTVGRGLAFAGATIGRFKPNGRVLKYSPLSRVIEFEALGAGVIAKLRLWESLLLLAESDPLLNAADLARHEGDARDQLDAIRRLHDLAVAEAFLPADHEAQVEKLSTQA